VPFGTVGYSSVEASLIPLAIDNDTYHASELISGDILWKSLNIRII